MSSEFRIPSLPVLDNLAEIGAYLSGWEDTTFVCIQHLLPTTATLMHTLIKVGAIPENIYVLGKHYSTHSSVKKAISELGIKVFDNGRQTKLGFFSERFSQDVARLWHYVSRDLLNKNVKNIIVLDEGGHCLTSIPAQLISSHRLVGIEQTTAGIINPYVLSLQFPLINVASSAAKKWLEPFIISRSIVHKLACYIPIKEKKLSCGIVGFGSIGSSVAERLSELGHFVSIYELLPHKRRSNKFSWYDDIRELITSSEFIFGCTGKDITKKSNVIDLVNNNKSLISCSSEDIEYNSLLRYIQETEYRDSIVSPLDNITYKTLRNATIRIYRGGFPINFDNVTEVEPSTDIQLTRGLLMGGIEQALALLYSGKEQHHAVYSLDNKVQQTVARIWGRYQVKDEVLKKSLSYFNDMEWISKYSGGKKSGKEL
jgi:S-adenosylhomocysteine hydrolase